MTDVHLNRHIGPIPNSSNNLGTFLSSPNQRPPDAHRVRSGSFNPNILASSKLIVNEKNKVYEFVESKYDYINSKEVFFMEFWLPYFLI